MLLDFQANNFAIPKALINSIHYIAASWVDNYFYLLILVLNSVWLILFSFSRLWSFTVTGGARLKRVPWAARLRTRKMFFEVLFFGQLIAYSLVRSKGQVLTLISKVGMLKLEFFQEIVLLLSWLVSESAYILLAHAHSATIHYSVHAAAIQYWILHCKYYYNILIRS